MTTSFAPGQEIPPGCKLYQAFFHYGKVKESCRHALGKGETYVGYREESSLGSKYNIRINRVAAGNKYSLSSQMSRTASKAAQAKLGASAGPMKFGAEISIGKQEDKKSRTSHKGEAEGGGDLIDVQVSGGKNGTCCSDAGSSSIKIFLIVRPDREQMESLMNEEMQRKLEALKEEFNRLASAQGKNKEDFEARLCQAQTALRMEHKLKFEVARESAQREEIRREGEAKEDEIWQMAKGEFEKLKAAQAQEVQKAVKERREEGIAIQNRKDREDLAQIEETERAVIMGFQGEAAAKNHREALFDAEQAQRGAVWREALEKRDEIGQAFQRRLEELKRREEGIAIQNRKDREDLAQIEETERAVIMGFQGEAAAKNHREALFGAEQTQRGEVWREALENKILHTFHQEIQRIKALSSMDAFGAAEWKKYFGDVGAEPPLPPDIGTLLESPCPFWPSKRICETHLLVLVPAKVNGESFTLNLLEQLIQKPLGGGHATKYRNYEGKTKTQFGSKALSFSHWVLMTRDVLEGTRHKNWEDQQKVLAPYAFLGYKPPCVLEAATALFMEHVRTGNRLYNDNPWTYTHCQELEDGKYPLAVGGFAPGGLVVHSNDFTASVVRDFYGLGGLRKF